MQNFDVILKGSKTNEALAELQKSVGSDVTLSMDSNGEVGDIRRASWYN